MEENNNNKTEKQQTVASYVHNDDDDVDDLDLCLGLRHPQHGNNIKMKRKEVVQNDAVIEGEGDEGGERRRKVVNWWGNVEMVRVSQGYNRHFTAAAATAENSRSPVSTGSSYSGVSDSYHSNSYAGGHSSDTSSHSSHSRLHLSSAKQPDSSNEDTNQNSPNHNRNSNHNQFSTNVTSTDTKDKEPSSSGPRSPSPKDTKVVVGKPPKPKRQTSQQSVLLPQMQMPCVSATGNGPNGKTITGFLYKYSKTEVSIVCVCHGTSFSPAGFVEHAGGVDVEHPLRHIRVAPFPLS